MPRTPCPTAAFSREVFSLSDSSIPQAHPAANLFPLLNEADTRALADDIAANGLLNPIVMHWCAS